MGRHRRCQLRAVTLLWDHLLRTYSYDPARAFTSADLGMAAKPDYPTGYFAQLAEPFRPSGACTTSTAGHPTPILSHQAGLNLEPR